jgi:F0F1-type ATP synthase delta subunit
VELKLPLSIVGPSDIARLQRELGNLNDFFIGAAARKSGTPMQPPPLSRLLDQLARDNGYNLLESSHRQKLQSELEALVTKVPSLHVSFAVEPPPKALEQVLDWFRTNIHPQLLLQVGLQPTIAAGCVLRTPNKVFDMSMRAFIRSQEPYLAQLIAGAANER